MSDRAENKADAELAAAEHREMIIGYRMIGRLTKSELDTITYMKFRRPERILLRAMGHLANTLYAQDARGGEPNVARLEWDRLRAVKDAIGVLTKATESITRELRTRLGDA